MLDFKALLFDLDGTLLDTAPDFITALNTQLKLHGRTPISNDAVRTSVTNGSVGLNSTLLIWPIKRYFLMVYSRCLIPVISNRYPGAL